MSRSMDDRAAGKPLGEEWKAIKATYKELADPKVFPQVIDPLVKRMDEAVAKYKALAAGKSKDIDAFSAFANKVRVVETKQIALIKKLEQVRASEKAEMKKIADAFTDADGIERYTKDYGDILEEFHQLTKALNDQIYVIAQQYIALVRGAYEVAHRSNTGRSEQSKQLKAIADTLEQQIRKSVIASEKIAVKAGATDAIDGLKALLGKL